MIPSTFPEMARDAREHLRQHLDALDRPLSGDWLKDCAQAKEARIMKENSNG